MKVIIKSKVHVYIKELNLQNILKIPIRLINSVQFLDFLQTSFSDFLVIFMLDTLNSELRLNFVCSSKILN